MDKLIIAYCANVGRISKCETQNLQNIFIVPAGPALYSDWWIIQRSATDFPFCFPWPQPRKTKWKFGTNSSTTFK